MSTFIESQFGLLNVDHITLFFIHSMGKRHEVRAKKVMLNDASNYTIKTFETVKEAEELLECIKSQLKVIQI